MAEGGYNNRWEGEDGEDDVKAAWDSDSSTNDDITHDHQVSTEALEDLTLEDSDDQENLEILETDSSSDDGDQPLHQTDGNFFDSSDEESSDDSSEDEDDITAKNIGRNIKKLCDNAGQICDELYIRAPRIDLNLMHDFTESDLFTIDGDSILADIFAHEGLDFSHGGQLLHLVYLVELFLQDFHEREGQFHIIFFTEAETIWHSDPLKLLARRVIIQHLARNTKCQLVTDIPHPYTQKWKDYIDSQHPAFIMLSDGESLRKRKGCRMLIRALLKSSVRLGVDCAFCSAMRRSLRSVNTFYVEARKAERYCRSQQDRMPSAYKYTTLMLQKKKAQRYTDQELTKICDQLLSTVEEHKDNRELISTIRDVITVIACAEIMKGAFVSRRQNDTDNVFSEGFARAWILHTILLQYLPLEARAQNIPNDAEIPPFCEGLIEDSLRRMHYAMARLVASCSQLCKMLTEINGVKETESLADLMDGRLLYVTLYQLQKYTENDIQATYSSEILNKFRYLWQISCSLAMPTTNSNDVNHSGPQQELFQDSVILRAPVHIFKSTSMELEGESKLSKHKKGLVPVSSELVTDYAGDLLKELESKSAVNLRSASAKPRKFEENYHWHTGKPLTDDYENTREDTEQLSTDPRRRKRQLENKQKFARYMQNYGESLEGRARGLRQQAITVDKSKAGRGKQESGSHQGQKKKQVLTSKEKILQEKLLRDQEKADDDAAARWAHILPDIHSDVANKMYGAALKKIEDFLGHCNSDKWTVEALLAKMDCNWVAWKGVKTGKKLIDFYHQPSTFSDLTNTHPMYYSIMLFVCCQEILEYRDVLNQKQLQLIGAYVRGLGFISLAEYVEAMAHGQSANSMSPSRPIFSVNLPEQHQCNVGMTCTRFQLQFVGQWMARDDRTDKDPRVPHFIPDTWQRDLLDIVDKNESALIVAPTSSGKTYASYYCMEKVLRRGHDGIVVYVSPTKALMNQVSATVYARFTKKQLPDGKVVCGVFSRDFRRNALNCQILVTVPQCLEILLLSPRRQEWAKRIQYVIFDEVHCLGGEIGAEVWEHLLVAIRCPFLALSATVRNPEDIRGWLQASQDFKQHQTEVVLKKTSKKQSKKQDSSRSENNAYKVGLVIHEERHSDLEKYMYVPKIQQKDLILPNDRILHDTAEFVPVHPVAMLNLTKVKSQGFPSDLSLSPRETLVLYDTMKNVHPTSSTLKALDPELHFKDIPILKKKDARDYENDLKKELMRWIQDAKEDTKVNAVINNLKQGLVQKTASCKQQWHSCPGGLYSDKAAVKSYAKLIRQLNEQNKLPALVFSQNRKLCENLAARIAMCLEHAETKLRRDFTRSPQWKELQKIMARLEKLARRNKNTEIDESLGKRKPNNQKVPDVERSDIRLRGKRKPEVSDSWHRRPMWRRPQAAKKGDKFQDLDAERFADCLLEATPDERKKLIAAKHFLLDDPLPSCTLQGEGNLTKEEVEEILSRLPDDEDSDNLCWMIARGVAYHHAGMNSKQRIAVETLFRMKHLKVASATSTLALGIHMPCKTVVFVCEDLWLKPLSFRQMSGRSGRRGYDLVGNVIFHCVPPQKIQHLITSGLPHLRGHFPFSVSLVLRLMVLTHNSEDKRDAHEKALALLKHPFVCHNTHDMKEVVQHFFLFSVDYLIRVGLLDADGAPIGLSGLATHLHYHEPANLTFVSMLQEGTFHELCQPNIFGSYSPSVMEMLVLILAHMFGRVTMPPSTLKAIKKQGVHSKVVFGNSLVLPPTFSTVLKKHNKDVSEVFRRYVHTVCDYAARSDSVKQNVLPLSKVAISPSDASATPSNVSADQGNLVTKLEASANHSTTLSPFVMTSGHADKDLPKFDADISQAIRKGVHIENSKIPTLKPPDELKDTRGKQLFINAYAYDFFKHGSKKLIARENGLESGDVFNKLNDFRLVISAISVALEELGPKKDNVVMAFKQLKEEYYHRFHQQFTGVRN